MNRTKRIVATVFCCVTATAGLASATDYTITWEDNFASNLTCTLKQTVFDPVGGSIPNNRLFTFTSIGQTVKTTISSPTCRNISLSASCSYTNSQGNKSSANFSSSATCVSSTATLNPTLPPSMTVTPGQEKPHGGTFF